MKPKKCGSCGGWIPKAASSCPRCNADLKNYRRDGLGKLAIVLFWAFNAGMAVWHIGYWVEKSSELERGLRLTQLGDVVGEVMVGSGEIVVYWLVGCLLLGIWVLFTRPD